MPRRRLGPVSEASIDVILLLLGAVLGALLAFWLDHLTEGQVEWARPYVPPAIGATALLLFGVIAVRYRVQQSPRIKARWQSERSPYPGLEAFTEADHSVFFGRQDESESLLARLEPAVPQDAHRFVAVVGPSGAGKSSLIHAGLLPLLARRRARWVVVPTVTPGKDPVGNLARAIRDASADSTITPMTTPDAATAPRSTLAHEIRRLRTAAGRRARALIVVDQAEELLTTSSQAERKRMLDVLRGVLVADSRVWIIASVRSDFLTAFLQAGCEDLFRDPVMLGALGSEAIAEVIEKPADQAGMEIEPGLVHTMVADTGGGEALPLLAYTLQLMYDRSRQKGVMTSALYREIGGVAGCLSRQADHVAGDLERRGLKRFVIPTLLEFVTVQRAADPDRDGGGMAFTQFVTHPTRRRVTGGSLHDDQRAVVDAFVAARLLTARGTDEVAFEVAHEALFQHWAPLREEVDRRRDDLRQREELERAADDWFRAERSQAYLLRGERLLAAQQWAAAHPDLSRALPRVARLIEDSARSDEATLVRLSQTIAQRALSTVDRDPELSLLLAIAAIEECAMTPLAQRALLAALSVSRTHNVLDRHVDVVRSVAWCPEDRRIASASHDGTVRVWEPDGSEVMALESPDGQLRDVAWSPDGTRLASASQAGTAAVWDAETGARIAELRGHTSTIHRLAWRGDGRRIATASHDGTARLWDVDTAQEVARLPDHEGYVRGVAWSPDGMLVATASADHLLRIWDAGSGSLLVTVRAHDDWVEDVGWSPDGGKFATVSSDRTVCILETGSWREIGRLRGHEEWVQSGSWSPDGRRYATASRDRTVRLWDTTAMTQLAELPGHRRWVHQVAWSHDGRRLASASYDRTVRVWDAEGPTSDSVLREHGDRLTDVAWSPDDRRLATASNDRTARIWDARTGGPALVLRGHREWVQGLSWSPDGKRIATASRDHSLRVWDASTGALLLEGLGHEEWVEDVAWCPDGRWLATAANDATVRVWDAAKGEPEMVLEGHQDWVRDVAWSPDGTLLASGSNDGTVRLWRLDTREATVLEGHKGWVRGVAWSPEGRWLAAAAEDATVLVWDAHEHTVATRLVGHEDEVLDVAWSPDSERLVTASSDRSSRLWDRRTGAERGVLAVHDDAISAVAWSGDGHRIATASWDRTAQIVSADIDVDALLARARTRVFRDLTAEERASLMLPETPTAPAA